MNEYDTSGACPECDATVDVIEYLGADSFIILDAGPLGQMTVRSHGDEPCRPGDSVGLAFAPERLHFFDDAGRAVRPA